MTSFTENPVTLLCGLASFGSSAMSVHNHMKFNELAENTKKTIETLTHQISKAISILENKINFLTDELNKIKREIKKEPHKLKKEVKQIEELSESDEDLDVDCIVESITNQKNNFSENGNSEIVSSMLNMSHR